MLPYTYIACLVKFVLYKIHLIIVNKLEFGYSLTERLRTESSNLNK